jgi:hypothetical protein
MVVTAETQVVQAAIVRRMTPLLMVAPVLRNPLPAQAGQLLLIPVIIGMEAQVAEEPVVLAARSQAAAVRQVAAAAAAAAADITAAAAAALQFKPQLIKP